MTKFHEIVEKAKELATKRGLQGSDRKRAMQNFVSEELDREIASES